uniref:Uncharacterized protein n=2 Tax=Anguilla anguilla TaxID=7936 RepID=A0A0E9TBE0_ANGAN
MQRNKRVKFCYGCTAPQISVLPVSHVSHTCLRMVNSFCLKNSLLHKSALNIRRVETCKVRSLIVQH